MEAAPAAIPPNPKIAATTAMIRNVIVQRNMAFDFLQEVKKRCHLLETLLLFVYLFGVGNSTNEKNYGVTALQKAWNKF